MTLGEANATGDASEVLPATGETGASGRNWAERGWLLALCVLIGWFYFWTIDSNGEPWKFGREQNDYYNLLLDGWLDGQLAMKVAVPEALLKLDDPYDPNLRPPGLALHDASFYRGKYYLYFGAAPIVVLMLPYRLITGTDLPQAAAVLAFGYGGFLASMATLLAIRRRHFPETSTFTLLLCVAILGFAGLGPVLIRRPHMWELPIGAGYCFAMLTLWCVWRSLQSLRRRAVWFAAAGVMLGLAIASRPTYLLASPLLAASLFAWWRRDRRLPWQTALAAAAPLAVVGLALAWHNYARFGNPLQFGQAYQLSLDYESKVTHFSPRYVPFNGWRYFFSAAQWSRYFPFIQPADLPPKPPGFAGHDDVYGVLRNLPIAWFALLAPLALWRRNAEERAALGAWLASTTLLFLAMAGVLLFFFGSLARYESDFTPALMLLACVGILALERIARWRSNPRLNRRGYDDPLVAAPIKARLEEPTAVVDPEMHPAFSVLLGWIVRPASVALAVCSVVFAVLFSIALDGRLADRNPQLAQQVAVLLNRIPAAVESLLGIEHGSVALSLRLPAHDSGERVLLTAGDSPHVARVFVRYDEERRVRFGFAEETAPAILSRPIEMDFTRPHEVRVSLGALVPPRTHPLFAHWSVAEVAKRTREVSIQVDGETVIDERRRFDGNTGRLRVGREAMTDASARFDGEVVNVRRERLARADFPGATGFVRLRLRFPDRATTPREPLVALGNAADGALIFVHYIDDAGRAAFGYSRRGERVPETQPISIDPAKPHEFTARWRATADAARRELELRLDGTILFSREVPWVERDGAIVAAQNVNDEPGGATRFAGQLLQVQRSASDRDPLIGPGDTLRLRLQLPKKPSAAREPLVVTGRSGAGDLLMIEYVDEHTVRFAVDHWGSPMSISDPVRIDRAQPHDVEITLSSLAAPADAALERHVRRGRVAVVVDGGRVWQQDVEVFTAEADEFWIGRNAIGGTNCAPAFTGEVLFAERPLPN